MKRMLWGLAGACSLLGGAAMAVEEPAYTVKLQEHDFELRAYPALIAAEVSVAGDQDRAASAGFRLLAGYIFGANESRQSVAMTAPVAQTAASAEKIAMTAPVAQTASGDSWTVRFFMPRGYTLDTLPKPKDPRIRLITVPPNLAAVVRFSGLAFAGDVAQKTAELRAFVEAHHWRTTGPPTLARYNPPWTPWFMRRNEVMLPVTLEPSGP